MSKIDLSIYKECLDNPNKTYIDFTFSIELIIPFLVERYLFSRKIFKV